MTNMDQDADSGTQNSMKAVIIANAIVTDPDTLRRATSEADLVIAADGGSRHCRQLGIVPDHLIGDMDSTSHQDLNALQEQGASLHRYPPRKDKTDLELALDLAIRKGARHIRIFGALGLRWDMTLANLMILTRPELARARVLLIDGSLEVLLIRGGDQIVLKGSPGDLVSLIPAGTEAKGVDLAGLEYLLNDRDIEPGSTLGISNLMVEEEATVSLQEGALFCVITHNAPAAE